MENTFYFVETDMKSIIKIFKNYDPYTTVVSCDLLQQTKRADTYHVKTTNQEYLLKIYPKDTVHVDISAYNRLKDIINVPKVFYHDESKKLLPYQYSIREYIKGETLDKYLQGKDEYPIWIIKEVAKQMALMHNETYLQGGKLNRNLVVREENQSIINKLYCYALGKAGANLSEKDKEQLIEILKNNPQMFKMIELCQCLTHGNLTYKNIIVSNDNQIYFIDFETINVNSWFVDIGSFIRTKDNSIEKLITLTMDDIFLDTYNLFSYYQLPSHWKLLAHLVDFTNILKIIDVKKADERKISYVKRELNLIFKEYASLNKEK